MRFKFLKLVRIGVKMDIKVKANLVPRWLIVLTRTLKGAAKGVGKHTRCMYVRS